ncbi:hypothetical protein LTR56_015833 [Elasticomyces elasticus]|nr:hypothetical protein LTR22_023032 [Elasticomyces elasticus]KAK3633418.1 hypothetical protein LTR56_015833 [Elasticomyces elasticus]KAK4922039.1 hypothetical protein LTR49_010625 [Elasticomyces elasticus]KAK5747809.1 hypothetical protein LTS12_022164 [Elasticomyces elasticus]
MREALPHLPNEMKVCFSGREVESFVRERDVKSEASSFGRFVTDVVNECAACVALGESRYPALGMVGEDVAEHLLRECSEFAAVLRGLLVDRVAIVSLPAIKDIAVALVKRR